MPDISRDFSFNVGIEGVMASASEVGRQNLPDTGKVLPGGMEEAAAVYGALLRHSLNDEIKTLLEPEIHNREVMLPEVFAAALDRCRAEVAGQAAATGSETLADLAATLDEVRDNRELCSMFRNLLLQG
jgi:hypothetical protein